MKFVKGIGLFFVYPLTMLAIGFYAGMEITQYFYPDNHKLTVPYMYEDAPQQDNTENGAGDAKEDSDGNVRQISERDSEEASKIEEEQDALYVTSDFETLYVGTEYVLEETDIIHNTVVETTWRLPDKYVGMNREQFLAAMETYAAAPPLTELERGFVGLEVLSFARERVVVKMNYHYVQPSSSFYLAAYDNKVFVYLEDKQTVYIETDILLKNLPLDLQQEIVRMMWIENEEALYNFLETYSS